MFPTESHFQLNVHHNIHRHPKISAVVFETRVTCSYFCRYPKLGGAVRYTNYWWLLPYVLQILGVAVIKELLVVTSVGTLILGAAIRYRNYL